MTLGMEGGAAVHAVNTSKKRVLREMSWILGCIAVASLGCLSEYGCSTVPFFAITFYTLTGVIRLFLYWYVRWFSR